MSKAKTGKKLIDAVDEFAMALLEEASSSTVPPENPDADATEDGEPPAAPTLGDRVAVLSTITRWVATKHRIKPEDDDDDWLSKSRRELNSANRGTARNRARGDATPAGAPTADGNGAGTTATGTGAD